ncbi:MAG: histone deacetylase, partial [Anaerolineales bacterium]|nr:histone deacetylase [Anaerolineales bacterium]
PERPGRFDLLEPRLASFQADRMDAVPATREEVARVHQPKLVSEVERACSMGPGVIDHAPTFVTQTSFNDALLAAGGVITCARAVLRGDAQNAFAIVRPPGHHAEPNRVMGFCLFNNIAIAVRDALAGADDHPLVQRVLIIDYDAHHGNGTQAAFLDEERVAFLSTHQWGIYPGTGWIEDAPHARKRIVNVPLPAYAGDLTYSRIADEIFVPFVQNFKPDMMLVSAGFDAHWNDPITTLGLSTNGFFTLSQKLVDLANQYCNGKIVFVLEGGYDPLNVAHGAEAVFDALTNSQSRNDAHDLNPHKEPDCEPRLSEVCKWHGF